MELSISQKHIDAGVIYDAGNCPVALAMADYLEEKGYSPNYIGACGGSVEYMIPGEPVTCLRGGDPLRDFVHNFDHGETMKPMVIHLEVVPT